MSRERESDKRADLEDKYAHAAEFVLSAERARQQEPARCRELKRQVQTLRDLLGRAATEEKEEHDVAPGP